MSTRRTLGAADFPPREHPDGPVTNKRSKWLCRVCKGDVAAPRRTFCSKDCVDRYLTMTSPQTQRSLVEKRDGGVCASCGLDARLLARVIGHARLVGSDRRRLLGVLGVERTGVLTLWEADHIMPVVEGGGVTPQTTVAELLGNLRTLCIACHRSETAALAGRQASARHDAKCSLFQEALA